MAHLFPTSSSGLGFGQDRSLQQPINFRGVSDSLFQTKFISVWRVYAWGCWASLVLICMTISVSSLHEIWKVCICMTPRGVVRGYRIELWLPMAARLLKSSKLSSSAPESSFSYFLRKMPVGK